MLVNVILSFTCIMSRRIKNSRVSTVITGIKVKHIYSTSLMGTMQEKLSLSISIKFTLNDLHMLV